MDNTFFDNYKPTNLSDINLNNETIELINIYLKNNKMLFLIHGPSLSGKTSLINILLKEYYNSSNYNDNIIYINLLKEQGINYFRNEIKNFCQIHNSSNIKQKSIIIDDFDSLNELTQKILITYINKYNNINFILSCSDLNKIVPSTRYLLEIIRIEHLDTMFLEKILNKVIKKTNMVLEENIKKKLLDDYNKNIPFFMNKVLEINIIFINSNYIIEEKNYDFLDNNILINIDNYLNLCKNNKVKEAKKLILELHNIGLSVIDILDNIIYYVKNINKNLNEEYRFKIIKLITNYINIFNNLHEDKIELLFLTNNIIKILK
jgi:DNA polymerase III delta prime subunit